MTKNIKPDRQETLLERWAGMPAPSSITSVLLRTMFKEHFVAPDSIELDVERRVQFLARASMGGARELIELPALAYGALRIGSDTTPDAGQNRFARTWTHIRDELRMEVPKKPKLDDIVLRNSDHYVDNIAHNLDFGRERRQWEDEYGDHRVAQFASGVRRFVGQLADPILARVAGAEVAPEVTSSEHDY